MAENTKRPSGSASPNADQNSPKPMKMSSLANSYLRLYNFTSLALWATLTIRLCLLLCQPSVQTSTIYDALFPLLRVTQSLAFLEVLHPLVRIVRASVVTTAMQVGGRITVVWLVMYMFSEQVMGATDGILGGGSVANGQKEAQLGDWAFIGCLAAWGLSECIRYGFFTLQVSGIAAPKWLLWLRYNAFFVLYPLGFSSECILVYLAITPAILVHPLLPWFFRAALPMYIPGSYILYTHMMTQRRKIMKAAKRVH